MLSYSLSVYMTCSTIWEELADILRSLVGPLLLFYFGISCSTSSHGTLSSKTRGRFCPGKEAPLAPFSSGCKKFQAVFYSALFGRCRTVLAGTPLGCHPWPPQHGCPPASSQFPWWAVGSWARLSTRTTYLRREPSGKCSCPLGFCQVLCTLLGYHFTYFLVYIFYVYSIIFWLLYTLQQIHH